MTAVGKIRGAAATSLDELIDRVSLHKRNPVALHGTTLPFVVVIGIWLYLWAFVYGIEEHWEAGLVSLAAIGCLQVLLCLCCYWSVHIQTFLTCRTVSNWNSFTNHETNTLLFRSNLRVQV